VCALNVTAPGPYPPPADNDDYYLYPVLQPVLTEIDFPEICSPFTTEGERLAEEIRLIKSEIEDQCGLGIEPDCSLALMHKQEKLLEYSRLLLRTPFGCQALLPSLISLQ
jgi:hypothetical protein